MLAKTAGVKHLVVLVNKMDDPTVEWDKGRLVPLISGALIIYGLFNTSQATLSFYCQLLGGLPLLTFNCFLHIFKV